MYDSAVVAVFVNDTLISGESVETLGQLGEVLHLPFVLRPVMFIENIFVYLL